MRRKHQRGYPGRFTRLASRYRSLFTLVWTFLALLSVPGFNGFAHAQSATHRVTFEGKFTASALASGVSVPSGEHFTTLIGAEQTITIIDDDATPAVTTCSGGMAGTYPCSNVDLMSFLALADIGGGDANDIWGWTDSSTGKEYAIMGRTNGTSFVDISDPVNPIYLGNLPPPAGEADERDIKVYADHAFIVTEANDSGMQVFDLTQLRAVASPPATFSETARYSGFSNAHNLAVNEDSGFAYAVGTNTCGGGLHMIDIQTPTNRTSAGCFSDDGYTHDAQCVNYDGPDPGDGVNPALSSASVNGAALTLTYGEALVGSSTPATDAFTVTVAGSGRTVTRVSVSGRVVTLTLASAVTDGQEVTVTYTVPGTNPIRDAAGNAAEGLSNDPVRNATPETTPPTISIVLSPGHGVPLNTAITATVTLDNLDPASYSSLVFRADLTEWEQAFARSAHCEGKDTGKDITVEVDASRETITVEVWKSCSQDIYAYFTLDAALFRLDTSAPGGRVELASAETRFAMSRYLQAGQTAPPPPAPGVAAWLDPDPTSFEWKVGESVVFRGRTDILRYLNHHLGVRGFGPEDGARFADDTDGLDAEEACRNVDDGIVDWRRAIHQPVRFFACRAGEATIEVWHETVAERLSTYEFRIRPADDDEVAAPVITTTSPILVPENETAVATLNATDDNTPIDQLTWTIPSGTNGGADADRFALSDAGALSFKAAKDYEIPDDADGDRTYEVTVQVSDGDNPVTADLLVTLENVLELTPLTGPAMVDYPENKALRVAAYIASSEEDREGLDWILSGADANRFSIGNPGGVLRFDIDPIAPDVSLQPPDFEDPADSNTDNVYSVTLAASDGTDTVTLDVSVTVGDENEAGTLSLDSPRPRFGEALTASVTDPDGDVSAITWKWERSAGRNAWVVIDGASAASYTPTAADTGAYLRVNVTYTDRHDVGQTAQRVAPNAVAARKLSRLEVTTSSSRSMYPSFEPEILHYAVGCPDGDTMTLTLSTDETDTRLAVNRIQRANRNVAVELTGLAGGSDIPITLAGSEGASTTYVLHCLADDFPAIVTEKKPGAWDGLITIGVRAPVGSYLAIIDNNGVPRIHWWIEERVRIFRTHRDGRYPYSYGHQIISRKVIVLDENLEPVDTVTVVEPLHATDLHDFVVKSNGNYLLLAYEPARRDLSQFTNSDGNPYSTTEDTRDSVIQEVTPDKDEAFNWNSWDHMAVEDCTQHRFPDDYAHVNSVQAFDDDIVASFRGCSKVLRIDGVSGDVIWRLGKSNRSDAEWTASGAQPPLRIVGDPYGEFCGQHSARMIGNGNLLLFDNGVACLVDPEGNRTRPGEDFSRIVEYAIDPDHGEAVFQRHYSYHGEFNKLAPTQGHIEPLETGNWLISWGSMPVNEQVTEYSPLTGEEVLIIKLHVLGDSDRGLRTTAYPVSSVALAKQVAPLTAEIVESPASSLFHLGPTDAPKVVVAFNQPAVDPDPAATTWPWVSVQGATIESVVSHTVPGDPANTYLFTLTPTGVGPITFAPVAGQSCASGGICTAAGTVLTGVPATAHTIPWVDTVAPVLAAEDAATVRGATLTLTFDEALATANTAASAFAVTGGTTRTISGVSVNGSTVQLTIDPPILYGESGIEVGYTAPSREALADAAGNKVASFEDRAVSNETPATTLSTGVSLSLDTPSVSEGGSAKSVALTAMLNRSARPAATAVTVEVGTAGDTATEGTDYAAVDDLTLTIPAYMTGITVRFTLTPMNDGTAEGTETISVRGNVAGLTVTPAELAIADDDSPSTRLDLSLNPSTVSEAAAPTEVAVTGSLDAGARTSDSVVTVTVGAFTDTATEGLDYANVSTLAITVPANETAGQTMFTLRPNNDATAEGAETISVTGRASGLTVAPAALTLSDNDTASRVVTLSVDPESVAEDTPENVTVTASLNAGARTEDTAVRLTVGAAGDTAVPGTDYERVPERTLTILSGETGGTAVFRLEPLDNDSSDGARTLSVTGSTTVAELRIEPASGAKIALADDDSPALLVMPDTLTVVEAGSDTYAVELRTRPTADVTVTITGVSGDLSLDKTSLVFTGADWSDPRDVRVTAADDADSVRDPDVTLTHRASGAAEYRGLRAELVVSIRENDPGLVFSEPALRVPEGQTATYTVALATLPTADVTVRVTGEFGDLSLDKTQLAFTPGDWDDAQTITVGAAEDDDTSTDPSVTLTHEASGGGYDGIVGSVRVSVTENDGGGTGGGSGGGGGANRPPVVEREIDDRTLDVGEVLELDIRLNFYDRDQRALDYSVASADPSVATAEVDRNGVLTIRGVSRGVTAITVTVADRRDERASDTFLVAVKGPALVALLPRASDPVREGFVRVINHAAEAGEVTIEAVDDTGMRLGPVTLLVDAGATAHFNSGDLEDGNAAKGLPAGVGSGEGDWRLVLDSDLDFEALSYIRTADGFLTAMHDTVPVRDGAYEVAIFNPGSNPNQVSRLRLVNPGAEDAQVTITGIDDAGASPGAPVTVTVPAGASRTIEAAGLEAGAEGFAGALGDGVGKWRLRVESEEPIIVMSLLSSPTGHLTNLSTAPDQGGM